MVELDFDIDQFLNDRRSHLITANNSEEFIEDEAAAESLDNTRKNLLKISPRLSLEETDTVIDSGRNGSYKEVILHQDDLGLYPLATLQFAHRRAEKGQEQAGLFFYTEEMLRAILAEAYREFVARTRKNV